MKLMAKGKPWAVGEVERLIDNFLIFRDITFEGECVFTMYKGEKHVRGRDFSLGSNRHDVGLVVKHEGDYTPLATVSYFPATRSVRVNPSTPVCINPEVLDKLWIYLTGKIPVLKYSGRRMRDREFPPS